MPSYYNGQLYNDDGTLATPGVNSPIAVPYNDAYISSLSPSELLALQYQNALKTQETNNGIIGGTLVPAAEQARVANQGVLREQQALLGHGQENVNWLMGQNAGIAQGLFGNAAGANAADQSMVSDYMSGLGAANAWDLQNYGNLADAFSGMSQLSPTAYWEGDLTAQQAQLTRADYQTAQLYQAALERARQNPEDVQAQREVLDLSRRISEGSLDIQNGGLTPEAKAAQLSALQQLGSLTKPEVTDQERFLYEKARVEQEQDERASRGAVMSNLRARGMAGSGMEIGNQLATSQRLSENRLLSDLGANAMAVQRAQQALQGYAGLSTDMMSQGNDVAKANVGARLSGLGVRAGTANTLAANSQALSQFNAGQANQNAIFNAGQANQNAMFNADAYNQNSMFNAGQANQISIFNTGQANGMAQFNRDQSLAQKRWQDEFAAQQQRDATSRATSKFDAGNIVSGNFTNNLNNATTVRANTTQSAYDRNKSTLDDYGGLVTQGFTAQQGQDDSVSNWLANYGNNASNDFARTAQLVGIRTGTNTAGSAGVGAALTGLAADSASREAIAAAERERKASAQPIPFKVVDPANLLKISNRTFTSIGMRPPS